MLATPTLRLNPTCRSVESLLTITCDVTADITTYILASLHALNVLDGGEDTMWNPCNFYVDLRKKDTPTTWVIERKTSGL
jgi:hypothetical protein